jgi:hypothetical protein
MVRSRVRGVVCWMYLLPSWLDWEGQTILEPLGAATDMLASFGTGGEQKAGDRAAISPGGRPAQ